MRAPRLETLGLLPSLGLLGCAGVSAQVSDAQLAEAPAPPVDDWRENTPHLDPMSSADAARLSSELALAARDYEGAKAHIDVALAYAPHQGDLRLGRVEAHIALGEFEAAHDALDELGEDDEPSSELTGMRLAVREAEHDQGPANCDASVTEARTPLQRHDDFLSVWNELRARLPADAALQIPTDDDDARDQLCVDDCDSEINILRLEGPEQSVVALLVEPDTEELWLVPELVLTDTASCEDDTTIGFEFVGQHVRVRAISDTREPPKTEDWRLGVEAELGRISTKVNAASASYYAAGSSGYASSGYGSSGYASSGYGSSGYGSSGYAYYGCGGGYDYYDDYYYGDYCEAVRGVERDMFIDLERGEVVLDIVRTGPADAALGRIELDGGRVGVEACGLGESLELSWTA